MKKFNSFRQREILLDSCGYARSLRDVEVKFDEARSGRWLGNVAQSDLNLAVSCVLVGLFEPGRLLLDKARRWVIAAIEAEERPDRYAAGGTEAGRFRTLAMCNWLLFADDDRASFAAYVENKERFLASSRIGRDPIEISLSSPSYLNAHAYDRALELVASGKKFDAPRDLNKIRGEAQMCYVLSRHRLNLEYSPAEVDVALHKFLMRNVESTWLGDGHWARAAEWMKIAHWRDGDDPMATVLRCYEYMPYERPAYSPGV